MKLTVLTLFLLLVCNVSAVRRGTSSFQEQTTNATPEIQKLEAQLKQVDEESGPVDIHLSGNTDAPGYLRITVKRTVAPASTATVEDSSKGSTSKTVNVDLLSVDVSKLEIPDKYIDDKIQAMSKQSMCGSLPGVKLIQLGASRNYQVIDDYLYDAGTYKMTVGKGFVYDRASMPRIFWVLIDKDSLGNVAPLIHDLLYRSGGALPKNQVSPYRKFSRKDADDLLLEIMTKCGVTKGRREAAYQAVRTFAGSSWKGD